MFVWIFIYLIVFSTHALTREISIHTIPRTPRIRTKFKRIHFRPPKHARSVSPGSTTTAVIFSPIPERREDAQGPSQCRGAIGNAWGDTFRWTMYVYPFRISQFLYLKQLTYMSSWTAPTVSPKPKAGDAPPAGPNIYRQDNRPHQQIFDLDLDLNPDL